MPEVLWPAECLEGPPGPRGVWQFVCVPCDLCEFFLWQRCQRNSQIELHTGSSTLVLLRVSTKHGRVSAQGAKKSARAT